MLASPSLDGSSNYATAQDLEAERILDGMLRRGGDAVMEDIQEGVRAGLLGPFSIPAGQQQDGNGARARHSRDANIEVMIDPALRQA